MRGFVLATFHRVGFLNFKVPYIFSFATIIFEWIRDQLHHQNIFNYYYYHIITIDEFQPDYAISSNF